MDGDDAAIVSGAAGDRNSAAVAGADYDAVSDGLAGATGPEAANLVRIAVVSPISNLDKDQGHCIGAKQIG